MSYKNIDIDIHNNIYHAFVFMPLCIGLYSITRRQYCHSLKWLLGNRRLGHWLSEQSDLYKTGGRSLYTTAGRIHYSLCQAHIVFFERVNKHKGCDFDIWKEKFLTYCHVVMFNSGLISSCLLVSVTYYLNIWGGYICVDKSKISYHCWLKMVLINGDHWCIFVGRNSSVVLYFASTTNVQFIFILITQIWR